MSSSEIRSLLRQLDKEYQNDPEITIAKTIENIRNYDKEQDFDGSFQLAMKLGEWYEQLDNVERANSAKALALVRASFLNDPLKVKMIEKNLDLTSMKIRFAHSINMGKGDTGRKHYYLVNLELQTLWGDFIKVNPIPLIDFNDENEVQEILEDYFPYGVYHVHMIERNTNQQRRVDIPVGKFETLEIVETVFNLES